MSKQIEKIVTGRCPNCQGRLNFNGQYLYCENQDYKANAVTFDRIWDEFLVSGKLEAAGDENNSEVLLANLQALNGKDLEMKSDAYSRPGCVFEKCPNPSICSVYRCQHVATR